MFQYEKRWIMQIYTERGETQTSCVNLFLRTIPVQRPAKLQARCMDGTQIKTLIWFFFLKLNFNSIECKIHVLAPVIYNIYSFQGLKNSLKRMEMKIKLENNGFVNSSRAYDKVLNKFWNCSEKKWHGKFWSKTSFWMHFTLKVRYQNLFKCYHWKRRKRDEVIQMEAWVYILPNAGGGGGGGRNLTLGKNKDSLEEYTPMDGS